MSNKTCCFSASDVLRCRMQMKESQAIVTRFHVISSTLMLFFLSCSTEFTKSPTRNLQQSSH